MQAVARRRASRRPPAPPTTARPITGHSCASSLHGRERPVGLAGNRPTSGGCDEQQADERPEAESAAEAPHRRERAARGAAGAARTGRRRRRGTARAGTTSTSCTAQPRTIRSSEVEVARRRLREPEPRVERAEEGLGGAAELVERVDGRGRRRAARPCRRTPCGGSRRWPVSVTRRDAAADERRLLAEPDREPELERAARSAPGRSGSSPVSSSTRTAAVRTSVAAGERGSSPAITRRAPAGDASASRLTTASARLADRATIARTALRRALRARRRRWRRTRACARAGPAPARRPRRRTPCASSTSAAVPEALSFAPGPPPVVSRCAMTTIASGRAARDDGRDVPKLDVAEPRHVLAPGVRASSGSRRAPAAARTRPPRPPRRTSRACGRGSRAPVPPRAPPPTRRRRAAGAPAAAAPAGRPTVNAASRSGRATSSSVPRTLRALIGRSRLPRRGGRRGGPGRGWRCIPRL